MSGHSFAYKFFWKIKIIAILVFYAWTSKPQNTKEYKKKEKIKIKNTKGKVYLQACFKSSF